GVKIHILVYSGVSHRTFSPIRSGKESCGHPPGLCRVLTSVTKQEARSATYWKQNGLLLGRIAVFGTRNVTEHQIS
ncbi:MAG TPA: hypothetical protein VJB70_00270, partial [Candidatus Paceibacterota bacterium]